MIDIISNFEKQLFKKIELEKDKFLSSTYYNKETKNLFCVFDMATRQYNSLLARINMITQHEFEQLMFDLMIEYGYVSNNIIKRQNKYTTAEIINYNGQIGIVEYRWLDNSQVSTSKRQGSIEKCIELLNEYEADTIFIVYCLTNDEIIRLSEKALFQKYLKDKMGVSIDKKIEILFLDEFFNKFFGNQQWKSLNKVIKSINTNLRNVIGYQINEICSPKNLKKFKSSIENFFQRTNWIKFFNQCIISENTALELVDTFINQKEYHILLKENEDYSNSFVTSEWFYQKYVKTNLLDFTPIMCGYFKCVEQLLHAIVLEKGYGKEFSINASSEIVTIDDSRKFESTLGSLLFFLRKNRDCFVVNDKKIQNFYFSELDNWIKTKRNGYFHKDNINNPDKLPEIRMSTMFVLFLTIALFKPTIE